MVVVGAALVYNGEFVVLLARKQRRQNVVAQKSVVGQAELLVVVEIVDVGAPSGHLAEHFGEAQTVLQLSVAGSIRQVAVKHMPGTE